jgi:hypothetical protein
MRQTQLKKLETRHKGAFKKVMELQAKMKQIKELKAKTRQEMLHPDPLVNQAYLELRQEEEMERIAAQKRARLAERGILANPQANGHHQAVNGAKITLEAATVTAHANGNGNGTTNGATNGAHHQVANGKTVTAHANGNGNGNGATNGTSGANGNGHHSPPHHLHHVQEKHGPILPLSNGTASTTTNGNGAPRVFKPLSKLFDDDILAELAAPKPSASTTTKSVQKPIIENPFLRKARY